MFRTFSRNQHIGTLILSLSAFPRIVGGVKKTVFLRSFLRVDSVNLAGLKRILQKKKVILIQLQESLIPLYLMLLLCNKIYDPPETKNTADEIQKRPAFSN